ncbi:macrolide-inactivating glycosyltransferase [Streptomyces kronopolitis]|uniref:Macrolide-inactivating glycosyltransferase n=2 Tax=Streptomyces kronopolitis TaxID=1612435 RepID=A0ABQ2JT22_9ACTN|nr:macrolide-inactivating glycosyltransferase [Streptomyces kronopolitis]
MTSMSHIAFMNIGLHGHLLPTLPVARELVSRGHRVSYAVPERFVPLVEATGARPVPYRSAWRADDDSTKLLTDFTAIVSYMLDEAESALPQLATAFETDRPDVFVYDVFAYGARVLGTRWGVPTINFWPFAVPYEGKDNGIAAVYKGLLDDPAAHRLRDRFSRWLAGNGIDMTVEDFGLVPEQGIASLTRTLQPHADKADEPRFSFVGPCFGPRSDTAAWTPPPGAERIVLVSLGSTFTNRPDIYRQLMAAFADSDWHVVLQTGKFVSTQALGPISDNVEVHEWLPQLDVLAHTDAFITHAGMGGTVEALSHGVPMLTLPQGADQFFISDRLSELGVGRRLHDDELTGGTVRTALEELLARPELTTRLNRLQEEIRTSGGAPAAADLIEKRLR